MNKEMGKRPSQRHSFILSLWTEAGPYPHGPLVWRISLENSLTSERQGFNDLEALARYLEKWAAEQPSKE